jgi:hypothetical protein
LEAREALLSAAKALSYLHARSLVHGNVDPAAFLAVGDQIKLSCDTVQPATESGEGTLTAAGDLRALGDCVQTMFTQNPDTDLEHLSAVPQPFRDIVRGCHGEDRNGNWTAQRIIEALDWRPAPAPVSEVLVVEATPRVLPERPRAAPQESKRFPAWTLALACVAALLIVLLARKPQPATAPIPLPEAGSRIVSAPPPQASAVRPAAEPVPQTRIWRVISYTYSKAEDAARMAGDINRKFPHFHAERFVPNGSNPPYYVALGGRMTRTEAMRLREQVVSSGFPADTFVRNFKR